MRILIVGVPYVVYYVGPNPLGPRGGWSIVADQDLTDHFHRNYFVKANEVGVPITCTCPAFQFSQELPPVCKHLLALRKLLEVIKEIPR